MTARYPCILSKNSTRSVCTSTIALEICPRLSVFRSVTVPWSQREGGMRAFFDSRTHDTHVDKSHTHIYLHTYTCKRTHKGTQSRATRQLAYPEVIQLVVDGQEIHCINACLCVVDHVHHCCNVDHMNTCTDPRTHILSFTYAQTLPRKHPPPHTHTHKAVLASSRSLNWDRDQGSVFLSALPSRRSLMFARVAA